MTKLIDGLQIDQYRSKKILLDKCMFMTTIQLRFDKLRLYDILYIVDVCTFFSYNI